MNYVINFIGNILSPCMVNESTYEFTSSFIEVLLWIAVGITFSILICYAATKEPWKKAYRMLHSSVYLCPIAYTIFFFALRIYVSIPLIIGLFVFFIYVEKKELATIVKTFRIRDTSKLKETNKLFVILITLLMIGISLLIFSLSGVNYTL